MLGLVFVILSLHNPPALLIEYCFCDNKTDAKLYSAETIFVNFICRDRRGAVQA